MYKKTIPMIVVALLCLNLAGYCQKKSFRTGSLDIGMPVPKDVLDGLMTVVNYPGSIKRISLNNYKGKLLILDFWATWCGGCVSAFSKLDSLQNLFKEHVQFLLVNAKNTGDTPDRIQKLLSVRKDCHLSSIINDTLLNRLFAHRMIPHYVWLRNDSLLASTSISELTEGNIRRALGQGLFNPVMKKDKMDVDWEKVLFSEDAGEGKDKLLYRVQFSRSVPGIPPQMYVSKDSTGQIRRYYSVNASRADLYRLAFNALAIPKNRIYTGSDSTILMNEKFWESERFCFEFTGPSIPIKELRARMQYQLEQYFGWGGKMEDSLLNCLVIRDTGFRHQRPVMPEGHCFRPVNVPKESSEQKLSVLIARLNRILPLPVLNEAECTEAVSLEFPSDLSDIGTLTGIQEKYGLSLSREQRKIRVLALRQQP